MFILSCRSPDDLGSLGPIRYRIEGEDGDIDRDFWLGDLQERLRSEDSRRIFVPVHGFNNSYDESIHWMRLMKQRFGDPVYAVTVGFTWPSEGRVTAYLDDRAAARAAAEHTAAALFRAVRWLEEVRCDAQLLVMAHSMGCYLLAHAARIAWEQLGRPDTWNAISELVLVAADLDGDVFGSDLGRAMSSLSRRVTVISNRRDNALAASSAKRGGMTGARLGRQGIEWLSSEMPENVNPIPIEQYTGEWKGSQHSAAFGEERARNILKEVLRSTDRSLLVEESTKF